MEVLLVSSDLMVQSRVAGAASRAGFAAPRAMSWREALALDEPASVRLVLLDLGSPDLDVKQVVAAIRERSPANTTLVAFGPHVQKAKLEAARDAGCDLVISRGQLDRDVEEILRQASGSSHDGVGE